jgi:hypothetical protein
MKIHSSITDVNDVIHRWVFGFKFAFLINKNCFELKDLCGNAVG